MKRFFLIPVSLVVLTLGFFGMYNLLSSVSANSLRSSMLHINSTTAGNADSYYSEIVECDDDIFSSEVIDNDGNIKCDKPFIIDFNATWCGPCKRLRPILEKVQSSYGSKIQIFSVDVDRCHSYSQFFDFEYIPYLVFVDSDGNTQEMVGGGLSEAQIRQYVSKYLHVN